MHSHHKEILCMKHGFECLIASQMIISSFLFSQNESLYHRLCVPYEMQLFITVVGLSFTLASLFYLNPLNWIYLESSFRQSWVINKKEEHHVSQ